MSSSLYYFLGLPTAIAFLIYGISCLFTQAMIREFERFGLPRYRVLIGSTQLLGALALLVSFRHPVLGFLGASGLAFQMAAGVGVRIRTGDSKLQTAQAALFFIINLVLAVSLWREL